MLGSVFASRLDDFILSHYDGNVDRRPAYQRAIGEGFPAGYAADDGTALHFVGKERVGAVSSRVNARAYRVEPRPSQVVEGELATRFHGS